MGKKNFEYNNFMYLKNKSRHIKEFLEESNKLRDDFLFSMYFFRTPCYNPYRLNIYPMKRQVINYG